ncbi:MAG: response regulator [Acidobacteria bacterium]|nr:response regulator [Acidobacteriota bacterium]
MKTILIVDDHPINREFLATLLRYNKNYHLLEARDGQEALSFANKERPDLVISDVLMPHMDGYELVKNLRMNPAMATTPVIFFTAQFDEREARALAASCGVATLLSKGSDPQVVLDAVEAALKIGAPLPVTTSLEDFDQRHLNLITNKLSQKDAEVFISNLRLQALIDITQRLNAEHNPFRLMDDYAQESRTILAASWSAIGLLNDSAESFQYFITSGLKGGFRRSFPAPRLNQSVFGELLGERGWRLIQSPNGEPLDLGFPTDYPPFQAFLGAAIFTPSKVYGCFCLLDKLGGAGFSDEDAQLALTLAAQLGIAYENSLRYEAIEQKMTELKKEVQVRQQAEAALQLAHLELENKVHDRTRELATVNVALSQEIDERKQAQEEREDLIVELQEALTQVKTLSALLPICSHCKNIRDDGGYWHQVENYISQHTDTHFSHGLCPDCALKHYPEFFQAKPPV